MNLNRLRDQAYKIACEHGFHDKAYSNEHFFCLFISELMEAVEADRKNKYAKVHSFKKEMDECLGIGWKEDSAGYRDVFQKYFSMFIKDTVEDDLADATIRLLDLAGCRNIFIEGFTEKNTENVSKTLNDKTFTEIIYEVSTGPIMLKEVFDNPLEKQLNTMLLIIFSLAKHLDIDLLWHIEQKMKYNQSRERMHGKKY